LPSTLNLLQATYVALLNSLVVAGELEAAAHLLQHIQQQQQQQDIEQGQQQQQQPPPVWNTRTKRQLYNIMIKGYLNDAASPSLSASNVSDPADLAAAGPLQGDSGVTRQAGTSTINSAGKQAGPVPGSSSSSSRPSLAQGQQQQQQCFGYDAALIVLQDMAAAGIAPAADTYTLFIKHVLQVGVCPRDVGYCCELYCCDSQQI
jgi:hypothetical protein